MSHTEDASVRTLDLLHRVPERWDGHTIDWGEWTQAPFICGPASLRACENCGCTNPGIMCSGWVEQSNHAGNVVILRTAQKKRLILRRCTGCAKTSVWDGQQFWDLDEEDYGPKGSYERREAK
ncbi:hypothetical protein CIP107521_00691 [Corynebacterium diphtheriae]|nr:hypothetical protein CIP107521_00691 [Corynebacterium diphtheriae]CAB0635262.1 hypothetical protein CIP107566_00531 [Corynebacterium diphtheriae]